MCASSLFGKVRLPELGGLLGGVSLFVFGVSKRKGDPEWAAVPRWAGPPSLLSKLALKHVLLLGTQAHEEL